MPRASKQTKRARKQLNKDEVLVPPWSPRKQIVAFLENKDLEDWDVILITDGSGGGPGMAIGWCGVIVQQGEGEPVISEIHGAQSFGTTTMAELWPIVQALSWHASQNAIGDRPLRVDIVSDRIDLVRSGELFAQGISREQPEKLWFLWRMLEILILDRYQLRFHYAPRSTVLMNCYADHKARDCYRALSTLPVPVDRDGLPVLPQDYENRRPSRPEARRRPTKLNDLDFLGS